jgi:hypothetical protein
MITSRIQISHCVFFKKKFPFSFVIQEGKMTYKKIKSSVFQSAGCFLRAVFGHQNTGSELVPYSANAGHCLKSGINISKFLFLYTVNDAFFIRIEFFFGSTGTRVP